MAYSFIKQLLSRSGIVNLNSANDLDSNKSGTGGKSDAISRYGFTEGDFFTIIKFIRDHRSGFNGRVLTLANGNYITFECSLSGSYYNYSTKFYYANDSFILQANGSASITDEVEKPNLDRYYGFSKNNDNQKLYFAQVLYTWANGNNYNMQVGSVEIPSNFLEGAYLTEDPYQTAPDSDAGGGYGDFDYTSDNVDFSDLPTLSVVDSGFVTLYNPSIGQLKALAQYMWSGLFDINTFRKIFADPMDCIISLSMIPLTPATSGTQELKVGNVGTGIMIDVLSSQFVEVNFAMKNIGLRSNGFMDFSPYTKAQIFLPYIGIRSLSIDDIAGKDLTLKYKIDLFTGACNAAIKCAGSVLYQFTGNVIANIPITAQNFSGMLQAAIGAVGTAVGVATGAGALAGVASAVNAATSMKPDIEKSGNLSATSGFLGQQMPYLILTYPNLCRPGGRDKTVGTPSFLGLSASNPARALSAFHGITKLHKINVKSIPCTDAERDEIEALLLEGVILP